jgi:hypothetical protein
MIDHSKGLRQFCHEKDCNENRIVYWNGEFIDKWYCKKHEKTKSKNV